jgi:hypothetical protein
MMFCCKGLLEFGIGAEPLFIDIAGVLLDLLHGMRGANWSVRFLWFDEKKGYVFVTHS